MTNETKDDIELTLLSCAVRALIATHPDQDQIRRHFDQFFGQILAGMIATGEPKEATTYARQVADQLFS